MANATHTRINIAFKYSVEIDIHRVIYYHNPLKNISIDGNNAPENHTTRAGMMF